ncbi:MAG: prepilin-type N-terminal cleavage/methylation domain-containing protein [Thermodesulfobacteriota bacterium]|nr:prepilin-type N-terminal cleavage/methylation domain-containing protein [Thermodesulfobacteriota bacterium]
MKSKITHNIRRRILFLGFTAKKKAYDKQNAGFTLLEVMITLAVIAISIVAILRALGMSVDLSYESKNITAATLLAKGKMAEVESEGFPEIEEISGDFGDESPNFRWEKSISEIGIEELRKVEIRVLWQEGNNEKKVELVTLISEK